MRHVRLDYVTGMGDFMRVSRVSEHLFICGYFALSQDALTEHAITCVVNATEDDPRQVPPSSCPPLFLLSPWWTWE